jgi:serine/threonine protein kinase
LLDREGHVRLSDFGLCKAFANEASPYLTQYQEESKKAYNEPQNPSKAAHRDRKMVYSTVGTPDYIGTFPLFCFF